MRATFNNNKMVYLLVDIRQNQSSVSTEEFIMSKLFYNGAAVPIDPKESVLDALLRAGHDVPYGCKSGACQACMLQAQSGELPPHCQPGLGDAVKQLGYFLSCSCYPTSETPLHICTSDEAIQKIPAVVSEKSFIGKQILRLRLNATIDYQPGQYFTLWRDNQLARSYSVASVPPLQTELEFHIKHIENGAFSHWAANTLQVGDTLNLQGPMGTCFYTPQQAEQTLLLAGIGTGLAPLYGIVRDALAKQHSGNIYLYVAARDANNFYYTEALKQLCQKHPNLQVKFVCQTLAEAHAAEEFTVGDIYQVIKQQHPNMRDYKVFLCGAESFVKKLKKQCFLAGTKMTDILADAFLASSVE